MPSSSLGSVCYKRQCWIRVYRNLECYSYLWKQHILRKRPLLAKRMLFFFPSTGDHNVHCKVCILVYEPSDETSNAFLYSHVVLVLNFSASSSCSSSSLFPASNMDGPHHSAYSCSQKIFSAVVENAQLCPFTFVFVC